MTAPLRLPDIASYLASTGWARTDEWHGAAIWTRAGAEVLVPASADLGDYDLRVHDLMRGVAAAEGRDPDEVARDIAAPAHDSTTYRARPGGPDGCTWLPAGVRAVEGVRRMLATAARTVVEGPRPSFSGAPATRVRRLLGAVQLTVDRHADFALTLRLPLDPGDGQAPGLVRSVVTQLYDATSAVEEAVEHDDDPGAIDGAAAAGVSADFCAALSDLAGFDRRDPFELDFRWAHRAPSELPARVVRFPPEAGVRIRQASRRLRRSDLTGPAMVTGLVESLHDDEVGEERWRVRVRGELRTDRAAGASRAVWVRLDGPSSYRLALDAHRDRRPVRVTGFRGTGARQYLAVPPGGLEILDPPTRAE